MALLLKNQRPASVIKLTPDDFVLVTPENLVSANGQLASATMYFKDGLNDWSDSCLLQFDFSDDLQGAIIDGFQYRYIAATITSSSGRRSAFEVSPMYGNAQRTGSIERFGSSVSAWPDPSVTRDLSNSDLAQTGNRLSTGPDDITLFVGNSLYSGGNYGLDLLHPASTDDFSQFYYDCGSAGCKNYGPANGLHMGTFANTFADFDGITFRFVAEPTSTTPYTMSVDAFELDVYYTPAQLGQHSLNLTSGGVTAVDGATAGVDVVSGVEVAWTSAANAHVVNTTIATSGVGDCTGMLTQPPGSTATDTLGTTQFLQYSFAGGQMGTILKKEIREIRMTWRGRVQCTDWAMDIDGNRVGGGYVSVDEVLLVDTGTDDIVLKLSDNDAYDTTGFKIGAYGWQSSPNTATGWRRGERDRAIALDISSLTEAQLTSLNNNGFDIYVRWKLSNTNNLADGSTNTFSAIAVNGAVFTLGYDDIPGDTLDAGNYKIGGCRFYARRAGDDAFICLGNANNIALPIDIQTLDHFTSFSGKRRKDHRDIIYQTFQFTFNLDELTNENMMLALRGDSLSDYEELPNFDQADSFSNITVGKSYKLSYTTISEYDELTSSPPFLTYVNPASSPVTGVVGVDYSVDFQLGFVTVLKGGAILDGALIEFEYDIGNQFESNDPVSVGKQFHPGTLLGMQNLDAFVFMSIDNREKKIIWTGVNATLELEGNISFSSADWASMPMKLTVLSNEDTPLTPYGTIQVY